MEMAERSGTFTGSIQQPSSNSVVVEVLLLLVTSVDATITSGNIWMNLKQNKKSTMRVKEKMKITTWQKDLSFRIISLLLSSKMTFKTMRERIGERDLLWDPEFLLHHLLQDQLLL